MNERIKELEKQCCDNQTNHLDTEKFAELIVKECAEVSANEFLMKVYKGPHQAHAARQAVLKHFGVEE